MSHLCSLLTVLTLCDCYFLSACFLHRYLRVHFCAFSSVFSSLCCFQFGLHFYCGLFFFFTFLLLFWALKANVLIFYYLLYCPLFPLILSVFISLRFLVIFHCDFFLLSAFMRLLFFLFPTFFKRKVSFMGPGMVPFRLVLILEWGELLFFFSFFILILPPPSLWQPSTCSLYLWVCFCFVYSFIFFF